MVHDGSHWLLIWIICLMTANDCKECVLVLDWMHNSMVKAHGSCSHSVSLGSPQAMRRHLNDA